MPENKINVEESKKILGLILSRTFGVEPDRPFNDLLVLLDNIKPTREMALEEADQRVSRLLNNVANTQAQQVL